MSLDATERTDEAPTPEELVADGPIIEVTDAALAKVLEIRDDEDDAESLGLRIEVTGVNGVDYTYDLGFEPIADALEDDDIAHIGELTVLVPAESIDKLRGSVLDLPSSPMQSGLVLRNPNRPNPLDGRKLDLTGDTADKVNQLLEQSINPSLAAHGGFASLVGVDGDKVFLTMGGGCQGCSLSQATMVEGIQKAIKEAIPEVAEVVDATDHTAGENPFYS